MKKSPYARKGFTLVELLTVIAIIGILAAIIIPTVGRVRDMASRAAGQSDIRSIAQIYFAYSVDSARPRNIVRQTWGAGTATVESPQEWAAVLADQADLNDASVYFLNFDPDVENAEAGGLAVPSVVGNFVDGTLTGVDADFSAFDVSVTVVRGLSTRLPSSSTPIVWTSGLETGGTWIDLSPYRGDGGHIGFVDGHVEWHRSLGTAAEGALIGTDRSRTNNILETINSAAQTLADRSNTGSADNASGTGN